MDLGGREVYGHLGRHRLPPPADPGQRERFELVRRGSLRERACACGNGRWTCESCGGGGQLSCPTSASCPSCAGTCHAEAYPERPPHLRPRTPGCPRCGRSGTACGRCKGRGTVRCDSCGGTGSTRCRSCGGGGTVAHSACAGTGRFSSWKEAVVKRKPAKAAVRLPDPPPPYLVRRRARGAGLWWSAVVDGYGPLPAGLQPEHAQAITPHLDRRETEIARRVTVRHLPLARVVVADEPHRHYYAFPGRAGVEVVRVPSPRQMNRFAWIGAASMGLAAAAALLVLALAR
ncbi:hypothetical protein [Streptomyces sp. NPDC048603]|uniref:hypothetical protein n=1 Tax=Streptomyces sp. NPDC048603 TaxID=3365577 RepID=UPI00371B406A